MACVDDHWQAKRSTISERTKFIFNNELLSDVKFIVPVSDSESKSQKMIPAHKFVLAISSPVFYAMFYGQMAETTDSVELPDCEYDSLLELFRYLYSDEVNLTGSNVMHVLYLAKKYMVPSLADKCTEYLRDNLEATNVFSILPHAQKFEDKDLEDRCWEVIELHAEEAVTSDEFVTLERSLVEFVVKREKLNINEVELFKAVDRWATKEVERQGITPDGDAKRRMIGEEALKAIRFPLMSQKEFVSVVFDSKVLNIEEICDMMKHFSDVSLTSPLPFTQTPRMSPWMQPVHRCQRFAKFQSPAGSRWSYSQNKSDCICVTVNKPIKLHGVQHFGSEGGKYTVSIKVKDVTNGSCLINQSGSYPSEKDKAQDYFGFDILFDSPVCLKQGKKYEVESLIKGPMSWYGEDGETCVECHEVQFNFHASATSFPGSLFFPPPSPLSLAPDVRNGTGVSLGQFPVFLFLV